MIAQLQMVVMSKFLEQTYEVVKHLVDEFILVTEEEIEHAKRFNATCQNYY